MAIEKWLAIGSIALFGMFVGEMIAMYSFMTDIPDDLEFAMQFEANPKLIQYVSIGAAPAGILAGVCFIMSRNFGSKQNGLLIITGGIVLLVGMIYCSTLTEKIDTQYVTDAVTYLPWVFVACSGPVMIFGGYLVKHQKQRPKKEYY
jgi:activator of 2-hydroxyglutaryl-CoA dehydratase